MTPAQVERLLASEAPKGRDSRRAVYRRRPPTASTPAQWDRFSRSRERWVGCSTPDQAVLLALESMGKYLGRQYFALAR